MQNSTLGTVVLQPVGTTTPSILAAAGAKPARVLVRNVGPILAFLALKVSDLTDPTGPSTGTFRLPVTDADVFVLAPGQSMYAVGAGLNGLVAIAVSEAYPIV